MRYCQAHWDALRAGVKARGLWKFVPQSGDEAAANMYLELKGQGETFDPLMGAHWRIANSVTRNIANSQGPLAAIQAIGDPDWCPLCEIQRSYDCWSNPEYIASHGVRPPEARDAQGWIDGVLDGALDYARSQKMPIGKPE